MQTSLIDIVCRSRKRKDLLLLLAGGAHTFDEIKVTLNVTDTGMLPQIKILRDHGLIERDNDQYKLTPIGKVVVNNIHPALRTLEAISNNQNYWKEHDIGAIPSPLLKRINELRDCQMVMLDLDRMFEPHTELMEQIPESHFFMRTTSSFHLEYWKVYAQLIGRNIETTIVVAPPTFERLRKEFQDDLNKIVASKCVHLFVCSQTIEITACVVTDGIMTLELFNNNGGYDHKILLSHDDSAIRWGKDLMKYYIDHSQELTPDRS
ncbi:MAG: helix-turn-helix transcriptional regulator [Methanosarcinaceae archaeon]